MQWYEDKAHPSFKRCFLATGEIKDYNFMINEKNFSDQPVRNYLRIYDNIQKITNGLVDYYITDSLVDYTYFQKCYKIIAIG